MGRDGYGKGALTLCLRWQQRRARHFELYVTELKNQFVLQLHFRDFLSPKKNIWGRNSAPFGLPPPGRSDAVMRAWNIAFPRVLDARTEEDVDTLMAEHMQV